MEKHTVYETLKLYTVYVSQLDKTIHARVSKNTKSTGGEEDFEWSVSHYYRPSENAAGAYIPSIQSGKALSEAESFLFAYLESFTSFGVIKNKQF